MKSSVEGSFVAKYKDRSVSVLKWAFFSRVLVAIVSVIGNLSVGEYDTSSRIYFNAGSQEGLNSYFQYFFRTFFRWDAVHLVTIAHKGYQFEQQFAFFPGLPFLLRFFSAILQPFTSILNEHSRLVLVGIILANLFFIASTCVLYKLTKLLFDEKFAWVSSLLFAFTPTPGFMSSIYTESFFAFFTFSGIFMYHTKRFWSASLLWMLASTFRSNGLLLSGYFIFDLIFMFKWQLASWKVQVFKILCFFPQFCLVWLPFVGFQFFAYKKLCLENSIEYQSSWCNDSVPLSYPYIQSEYWDCGFLKYFTFNETGNFLLATPFILVSAYGIACYAQADTTRFFSIGLFQKENFAPVLNKKKAASTNCYLPFKNGYFQTSILPHIYLWLVLISYGFTSMHVQVLLRFLTSMPALYWFVTHTILSEMPVSRSLIYYWVIYGFASTILFACFLPPA